MDDFWGNILIEIVGGLLFTILVIGIGWIFYFATERRHLLGFFNITTTKRLVIYLSNLRIVKGGSVGIDNKPRNYYGTTVIINEQLAATQFKEKFNYLVPSLSESPTFLSKILFADIKVTSFPSPLTEHEIEANCSIISFGSPGYNKMSEIIEANNNSVVKFVDDNRAIQITGIPKINDPQNGFIQRIVTNQNGVQRSLFYAAGLTERGTIGAANYLMNNWKYLQRKFKNTDSFIILLRFTTNNLDNFTVDLERTL